ncbi:MAG: glycine betaine/proline transport system permease protein [Actinomycetota bacterium]|nr:glycine betaine/proline transport system permease protein [Actinomycetota bacterium]
MTTIITDPGSRVLRPVRRRWGVVAVVTLWILLGTLLSGRDTLALGSADITSFHRWLNDLRASIETGLAGGSPVSALITGVRTTIGAVVGFGQDLVARPSFGRPVPGIGWLGVVAIAGYVTAALAGARVAVLTVTGLTFLGLQGLWQDSMDTLTLTAAAVGLALVIGLPIGVAAGVSPRTRRLVTPVLDVAQTMPAFVYLTPLTLVFLIGPASATITTLIYALPPVIRLTVHGIRTVPGDSVEAAVSLGTTGRQRLVQVLLPMARRTIVLGINQTIMAALSMVTIAALIDAPGLGRTVLKALETLDVGVAFNAGLAIVVLAVMLDRITSTVADRGARPRRDTGRARIRAVALAVGGLTTLWLVQLSRTYLWAARFPETITTPWGPLEVRLGDDIARGASLVTRAVETSASGVTSTVKDAGTILLIDPLQALLSGSPWWLVTAAAVAIAWLVAGTRAAVTALTCLLLVLATGLWSDSMVTLAATGVATAAVMLLGVILGVWMGRDRRVEAVLRPQLDAGQTMPAFVYLVPFVALFGASRFTAIAAAVLYAAPAAVKIVADGVRAVPVETLEAAVASGSTTWQVITKVQLPMARPALALALNQGLMYVLSMVVVGGLVGAGALGYDVVAGFSQGEMFGKGLAAGLAIVVMGILLDRVSQAAARRVGAVGSQLHTRR